MRNKIATTTLTYPHMGKHVKVRLTVSLVSQFFFARFIWFTRIAFCEKNIASLVSVAKRGKCESHLHLYAVFSKTYRYQDYTVLGGGEKYNLREKYNSREKYNPREKYNV